MRYHPSTLFFTCLASCLSGTCILIYQTEDGRTRIDVRLEDETVWLSQKLMSELYQVGVNTINYHIKAIYDEGELSPDPTIRKYRIVQTEGNRQVARQVDCYNLDVIISVGYRVHSHRGISLSFLIFGSCSEKSMVSWNR